MFDRAPVHSAQMQPHPHSIPQQQQQQQQPQYSVPNNGQPMRVQIPLPAAAPAESRQLAALQNVSKVDRTTGRRYTLSVAQQPRRARMCGFGDKDRRPITPPPCIRLVIVDESTGKEVDCNEIDHGMFVLNVDLWSEDGSREVNLVRHTTGGTPSISSTTPASFASLEPTPAYTHILPSDPNQGYAPSPHPSMNYSQVMQPYGMQSPSYAPSYMSPSPYAPPNQYYPSAMPPNVSPITPHGMISPYPHAYPGSDLGGGRMTMGGGQPQGMYTRNLIGSLAASAFRLTDPDDKIGIWFILQDLSIRTEGNFRLRFSYVNVGPPPNGPGTVNTGRIPILASCFSDVFTVFSAKKFPGVCESTPLSKCFATQGIKIPIRKEGANKNGEDDDDY